MTTKERRKRPKLERTRPIRSWSTLFAVPENDAGATSAADATNERRGGSLNDVVSRSVDLGYRVIDEYIRQGQKAARRLNDRSYGTSAATNDMQEITTRFAQFAADFSALVFNLMQTTIAGTVRRPVPAPDGAGAPAAAPQEPPRSAPPNYDSAGGDGAELTRVRVAVSSPHPTEVSLDLRPCPAARRLTVHSLRAVDPRKPRLSDVAIEAVRGDEPVTLRIRVPAGQPAGVYNGLIIDEETSRPVGTVSLRVAAG